MWHWEGTGIRTGIRVAVACGRLDSVRAWCVSVAGGGAGLSVRPLGRRLQAEAQAGAQIRDGRLPACEVDQDTVNSERKKVLAT